MNTLTRGEIKEIILDTIRGKSRNIHITDSRYHCPSTKDIAELIKRVDDSIGLEEKRLGYEVVWEKGKTDCNFFAHRFLHHAKLVGLEHGRNIPYSIGFIGGFRLFEHTGKHGANFIISANGKMWMIEPQIKYKREWFERPTGQEYLTVVMT